MFKTIRWSKVEYLDIGNGFTAIIESRNTPEGIVMKAYIYRGLNEDQAVMVTSVLSSTYDVTYLYSLIFGTLADKEECEKFCRINTMRNRKET